MRTNLVSVVSLVACLCAAPLAADPRQQGNVIIDLPEGWTVGTTTENGTLVVYSDLPDDECEFCYIYIASGDSRAEEPDRWITANNTRFVDQDDIDPPVVEPMSQPDLFNFSGRPGAMLGQKVDGNLQMLFAVQLPGRMELIGFQMPADDEEELAANMAVFQRDVMPAIEAARFVSEGADPLMPPPEPGLRQGLYWGTSTYWTTGLDLIMTMQISHHWLTFWPDGTFYDGTPPNGLAAFDPADRLAKGDMSWGSYVEEGGKLTLSYASGEVEVWTVTDEALQQDDTSIYPVDTMASGTKINGSVSTFFYSGFSPGSGLSGGVSSSSLTEFQPDGTWNRGASSGAAANFDSGGGFATSGENSEGGRYQVKDGLVVQYNQDGTIYTSNLIFRVGSDIWIGSEALAYGGQ